MLEVLTCDCHVLTYSVGNAPSRIYKVQIQSMGSPHHIDATYATQ